MPTLSPGAVKVILRYISDRSDKGDDEARKLMPFLVRRAAPKKTLAEPLRKAVKKTKRETRKERRAVIRSAALQRCGAACELCLTWLELPGHFTELHHLESGNGRRSVAEGLENCMIVHDTCHRAYHRDPEAFREHVTNWANWHKYPVPSRFRREPKESAR